MAAAHATAFLEEGRVIGRGRARMAKRLLVAVLCSSASGCLAFSGAWSGAGVASSHAMHGVDQAGMSPQAGHGGLSWAWGSVKAKRVGWRQQSASPRGRAPLARPMLGLRMKEEVLMEGDGLVQGVTTALVQSLKEVSAEEWDACSRSAAGTGSYNPFLSHAFLSVVSSPSTCPRIARPPCA